MFEKIFGKKEELKDMIIYWRSDVKVNDMLKDLDALGSLIVKPSAWKNGCRIVTVRETAINGTKYASAELIVDKFTEKTIRQLMKNNKFAAVKFSETII